MTQLVHETIKVQNKLLYQKSVNFKCLTESLNYRLKLM